MKANNNTILKTVLFITAILIISSAQFVTGQSSNKNYIKTEELFTPVTNESSIDAIPNVSNGKRTTIAYFDGLGRPIQTAIRSKSPGYGDIVQHIEYDQFGRQPKSFLPFIKDGSNGGAFITTAADEQLDFYASGNPNHDLDIPIATNPFSQTRFEESPLNRVLETASPGDKWAMNAEPKHTVDYQYSTNSTDVVKRWQVGSDESISSPGNYGAGKLYKNTVTDEDGNTVATYTTLDGLQVLVRRMGNVDTYYVYNDLNLLVCVIMPMADITPTVFSDWNQAYRYKYDGRKRMVEKQPPGAAPVYYVYNKADQLVFEQDGNHSVDEIWKFYKYDGLGRIIMEGTFARDITRQNLQTELDNSNARMFEVKDNHADSYYQEYFGYSNEALPDGHGTTIDVTQINFYDNYDFDADGDSDETFSYYYNSIDAGFSDQAVKLPQGQLTGKSFSYLSYDELYFYDEKGRVVQTKTGSYNTGNTYNFNGLVKKTNRKYKINATSTLTYTFAFGYDHDWRLSYTNFSINNGAPQRFNTMKYTELSSLKTKYLHGDATTFLQKQDYRYNIRGWLTQTNDVDQAGTDIFAEKLYYENLPGYYNNHATALFNGNISGMEWFTKDIVSAGIVNGYAFRYDPLNRLTDSDFFTRSGGTVNWHDSQQPSFQNYGTITGIGSENITYDKNGNIKFLVRKGRRGSEVVIFDSFTYTYDGNKLLRVRDIIGGQNSLGDFRNTASITAVNDYDQNGNLIRDIDRNMIILYNRINLPYSIGFDGGRIQNDYHPDGVKTAKVVYDRDDRQTLSESYYSDLVLNFNVPVRILHADGVIELDSRMQPTYYYHLKDHLGNVRAVVSPGANNTTVINQTNEYYPFGMAYTKSASSLLNPLVPNKYKYNGKEEQEMPGKWLDYGARFYDTQLGRWHSIDPMSEVSRRWSPYQYGYNNPIRFIDPDGKFPFDLSLMFAVVKANIMIAQNNATKTVNEIAKTAINMPKSEIPSKGEDVFSFTLSESKDISDVASISASLKFSMNEDARATEKIGVDLTLGETVGFTIEATLSEKEGKNSPQVDIGADAGIVEPDIPSLPVEVNASAAIRVVDRMVESVQNFVEQKKDEIVNPQKYIKYDNQ
jgi:RHS repeat-associated protein